MMDGRLTKTDARDGAEKKPAADRPRVSGDSLSMHADVPVWCDCCSCEAEPYWIEALGNPDDDAGP